MRKPNIKKAFSVQKRASVSAPVSASSAHKTEHPLENLLYLNPTDIDCFSGDVRTKDNAAYPQIKASIRESGMDNPIQVAMHPKKKRWTVYGGGNSRLKAAQELKLKTVPCREIVWESDADALIRHLRENDLRHGYSFLERCLAAERLVQHLESGGKKTSLDEFMTHLQECGYPESSSRKLFLYYPFALRLKKYIPLALTGGLGQNAIADLSAAHDRAVKGVEANQKKKISNLFLRLLKANDSPAFSHSSFLPKFHSSLAQLFPAEAKKAAARRTSAAKKTKQIKPSLARQREMMYLHSHSLAEAVCFEKAVKQIDFGLGFVVNDFPRIGQIERARALKLSWIWWQLVSMSDIAHAPKNVRMLLLPEIPDCYRDLLDGDFEPSYTELEFPNFGDENYVIFRVLSDADKTLYLASLALYWEIFRTATEIWPKKIDLVQPRVADEQK